MNESLQIKPSPILMKVMNDFCARNTEILLVSLCTTDGFRINSVATGTVKVEDDKIAAMSSTICALSNSSAHQIVNQEFLATTIETSESHFLFLRTDYTGTPSVLTSVVNAKMTLATARYTTRRLAMMINSITISQP